MDEINPDKGKCYEENGTSRVTRMALQGGSLGELWGIREDFPEGDKLRGVAGMSTPFVPFNSACIRWPP